MSLKSDYGLILLSDLAVAEADDPVSLRAIADNKMISFFFLQKVALDLRKAGLIKALRGKRGGYILAKDPRAISIKEILEAIEGPIMLVKCLEHEAALFVCDRENRCFIKRGFGVLNGLIVNTLESFSLYDFLNSSWQKSPQKKG